MTAAAGVVGWHQQAGAGQVMVFFSSCAAVKFHAELLNYIDMPVKDIHGKQKQVCGCSMACQPALGL